VATTTLAQSGGVPRFDASAWLEEHGAGDILMTPDGWMTEINRSARRILRLPSDQAVRGLTFRRFCRQPACLAEVIDAVRTAGFVRNWDAELMAFDGRPVHAVVHLVGDVDDGFLTAVRIQLFDIADWRRSQERTLFGQRIEAIGRLAGGVAHDFNNLLTVISGHAERLAVDIQPDSQMQRSLSAIHASTARAATLTQKLLSFGRRQVLQPSVCDLGELTRRAQRALAHAGARDIALHAEGDRQRWPVHVDPARTERAMIAIASHAVESMADGGVLTFRLSNEDIGPEWSPTRTFVKPGRFVRLDVICRGMTLDVDVQVRMFEPFFSEKGIVRDGLGLAAAFGLVKQSGGYLWLESDRPGETVFTMLLPTHEVPAEPSAPPQATILVVDEDDAIRGLIVKILAHQGHVVLEASSPEAASRLARSGRIHLLIAGASVVESAANEATLQKELPHDRLLPIANRGTGLARDGSAVPPLRRPFTAAELLARVRTLLDT
jgi:signal transduction histidine kinase